MLLRLDEKMPRFYGVAYYCCDKSATVCYPIPINAIVRTAYGIYLRIRMPRMLDAIDKAHQQGYEDGRAVSNLMEFHRGYEAGLEEARKVIQSVLSPQ